MDTQELLLLTAKIGASDLHITVGSPQYAGLTVICVHYLSRY